MKKFLVLSLIVLAGCGSKNWAENYKYVAPKGWTKEKYVMSKLPKPPSEERSITEGFRKEEEEKLIKELVKKPPVPLKLPDKILRVLILPWVDREGNFHGHEYVFIKVEEGKWIIGNYPVPSEEIEKEIKPLEEEFKDGS